MTARHSNSSPLPEPFGSKGLSVYLEDHTLIRLCAVTAADLDRYDLVEQVADSSELSKDYYSIPLEWFDQPVPESFPPDGLLYDLGPKGVSLEDIYPARLAGEFRDLRHVLLGAHSLKSTNAGSSLERVARAVHLYVRVCGDRVGAGLRAEALYS